MLSILLAICIGAVFALQSPINAQLRKYVISPFLASLVSFAVGVIFLAITIKVSGSPLGIPLAFISSQPIFIWLGGICGAIALTTNVLLFPKLGSVQTAILPILGMTLMSMLIDNFGWFNSVSYAFGFNRVIGVILVIMGVFLTVAIPSMKTNRSSSESIKKNILQQWFWRLVGIISGGFLAMQIAINGQLGKALNSPAHAAFISFFIGTLMLIIIVGVIDRSYINIKNPIKQSASWWVWVGGIIGGTYVLTNVYLVARIGNGQTVVLALLGQITASLMVEQFGLFNSIKKQIIPMQIFGLIIMVVGVFLIKLV